MRCVIKINNEKYPHINTHKQEKLKHIKENGTFDYDHEAVAAASHCCWLAGQPCTALYTFHCRSSLSLQSSKFPTNRSLFIVSDYYVQSLFDPIRSEPNRTDPISIKFSELVKLKLYALHLVG